MDAGKQEPHPALHIMPVRGEAKGKTCFINYHNSMLFGLGRDDCWLNGTKRKEWCEPSNAEKSRNTTHITKIQEEVENEKKK